MIPDVSDHFYPLHSSGIGITCENGAYTSLFFLQPSGSSALNPIPLPTVVMAWLGKSLMRCLGCWMGSNHCYFTSAINAPLTGNTFQSFQTSARLLNNTVPPVPSGALSGSGAAASLQPGPLLGSVTGAALPPGSTPAPSATAPAPGASGSSVSGSGSQSGTAPGASNTSNDASTLATGGFVGFVSALLGVFLF